MDIGRRAFTARPIKFVRADLNQGGQIAVIGAIDHNNVLLLGVSAGQAQGQVIGFAPGTDEEANPQRLR